MSKWAEWRRKLQQLSIHVEFVELESRLGLVPWHIDVEAVFRIHMEFAELKSKV